MASTQGIQLGAVLAAVAAFAATILGTWIDGCNDRQLQQEEFRAQLILGSLDAETASDAVAYLQLIENLGLVQNLDIEELEAENGRPADPTDADTEDEPSVPTDADSLRVDGTVLKFPKGIEPQVQRMVTRD